MDGLDKYINERKKKSPEFKKYFDKGYEQFKIGILLKQASEEKGPVKVIRFNNKPLTDKEN